MPLRSLALGSALVVRSMLLHLNHGRNRVRYIGTSSLNGREKDLNKLLRANMMGRRMLFLRIYSVSLSIDLFLRVAGVVTYICALLLSSAKGRLVQSSRTGIAQSGKINRICFRVVIERVVIQYFGNIVLCEKWKRLLQKSDDVGFCRDVLRGEEGSFIRIVLKVDCISLINQEKWKIVNTYTRQNPQAIDFLLQQLPTWQVLNILSISDREQAAPSTKHA